MSVSALVLIYNHRYDANIERLNEIYGNRFSCITHLVPFYDGTIENVIPVYENSHRFNGFVAQAAEKLLAQDVDSYVFAADDLLLNPCLDSCNILSRLGIPQMAGYTGLHLLHERESYWRRILEAVNYKSVKPPPLAVRP